MYSTTYHDQPYYHYFYYSMLKSYTCIKQSFRKKGYGCKWASEWLLFNTNLTIFQLYHGETICIQRIGDDEVLFVLDQHS